METRYRAKGMTATIRRLENGYLLTLRDRRGHIFRRRRHRTSSGATFEMWSYLDGWEAS